MGLNLGDCLRLSAIARPQAPCLIFDALRLSYAEVDAAARRVAGILLAHGLRPGDRVGVILPNVPQFPIIYYGILYAGGTVVPLNPLLRPRELAHVAADTQMRALFVFEDVVAVTDELDTKYPNLSLLSVVESGMASKAPARGSSFMESFSHAVPVSEIAQTQPQDIAVVLYTAAQQGRPRGAMLSHFNLFVNALTISTKTLRYFPEDVFLCVLPLFHGFGQTTMMNAPLMTGSSIVLSSRFDATHTLELIRKEGVTLIAVVPTMLHFLVAGSREDTPPLPSLRCVVAGGSKMNLDTAREFSARFGSPVLEGYGLSETSPVVAFNCSAEVNRPGSVGPPIWGCEVAIHDEHGVSQPAGVAGEVVIRGHNVFQGYLNDPAGTQETMRGGWLHTGDRGYLDADGYLYLSGLKKDMILRAGMNVYPREVELVLESHPDVAEAAVVGVPDVVRGEDVKAFVVCRPGSEPSENDLKAFCRDALSSYKCPRRIAFVDHLPRDASGAIDKPQLRMLSAVEAAH